MRLKDLTLREKVYKTLIMNKNHMKVDGTLKEYFEKYPIGGVFYSKGAVAGLVEQQEGESVVKRGFVEGCREAANYPLIVCADGATIGDTGLPACNTEALGAADSEELAYRYGKALGMQMNANDVDWIFGPCIDMPLSRTKAGVNFNMSDDPEFTVKIFKQVVRGIQDQNVAATIKHFPGCGTDYINCHLSPAGKNDMSFDEWEKTYGYTYRKLFEAGVMSVMTTHIALPAYSTKADFGDFPISTYSKDLTIKLLKEELGFGGVVVTDAMTMAGCAAGDQVEQAVAAFACGADFILWPPIEAGERIIEELESGRIPMERLDDAMERIERFMNRLGIEGKERKHPEPDADFVDLVMKETIEKGIVLVRNKQGNVPLTAQKKRILVDLVSPQVTKSVTDKKLECARYFVELLQTQGFDVEFRWNYSSFFQPNLETEVSGYDAIVVLLDIPMAANLFRDGFNGVWTVHLMPMSKKIILNFGSPFFIDDYYPREDTFVQMNAGLDKTAVEAAVDAILGKREMTGTLQVKVKI